MVFYVGYGIRGPDSEESWKTGKDGYPFTGMGHGETVDGCKLPEKGVQVAEEYRMQRGWVLQWNGAIDRFRNMSLG